MGGGGSQSSNTQYVEQDRLPDWIEIEARRNLDLGNETGAMGYTPNLSPSVTEFNDQQLNAMASTDRAAQAFGMPNSGFDPSRPASEQYSRLTGMDRSNAPETPYGFRAYSPAEQYFKSLEAHEAAFPGQSAALRSMIMDPVTGAQPVNPLVPNLEFDVSRYLRPDGNWISDREWALYGQPGRNADTPDPGSAGGFPAKTGQPQGGPGNPNDTSHLYKEYTDPNEYAQAMASYNARRDWNQRVGVAQIAGSLTDDPTNSLAGRGWAAKNGGILNWNMDRVDPGPMPVMAAAPSASIPVETPLPQENPWPKGEGADWGRSLTHQYSNPYMQRPRQPKKVIEVTKDLVGSE